MVVNATALFFLPRRNFQASARMGRMHQCARGLWWQIMILLRNKQAVFNIVIVFRLMFLIWRILLIYYSFIQDTYKRVMWYK